MKKMREVNYIFYMTLLYMLSSLYTVLNKGKVYKLFDIENLIKYDLLLIIVGGLGIVFLLVNYYRNTKQVIETVIFKMILPIGIILLGLNYPNFGLDGVMYAIVVYLIVAYIFMYPVIFCKNRVSDNENNLKLYPSRRNLKKVLEHGLKECNLITLDGTWGSGKTTFMDIVMRDNREKYYYIPINVMLFENRNSLKTEFLNQLKGIFKEEGIFQGSLMDFDYYLDGVSNDWIKMVKNIIFSKSKSFKEANEKLKNEIGKIEKRIVVGVDNLERIYGESEQEWKQILGFIHELQELGIKIVVMSNLKEMPTEEENGKKDLSNHEYFDKFEEFKLSVDKLDISEENYIGEILNEIPEIDDELKEWYITEEKELYSIIRSLYGQKQGELKDKINKSNGTEKKIDQSKDKEDINSLKEEIKQIERYNKKRSNPRSVEKILLDIKVKKTIENIFKPLIDDEMYKKTIFRVSVFLLLYLDLLNEYEKKGITNEKNIINFIFSKTFTDNRAINRLLFYEAKDDTVKKQIESIKKEEIIMSNINQKIKDLKRYEERLDSNETKEISKKVYKMIEEKLIELEKTNEKKIHKIIKENEENICRLNYLTYSDGIGIFKDIKYKFNLDVISETYSKEVEKIKDIVLNNIDKGQSYSHETMPMELVGVNMNIDRVKKILFMYCEKTMKPTLSPNDLYKMTKYSTSTEINFDINISIKELKEKLNNRKEYVFFEKSVEDIVFKRVLILLNILEKNEIQENNDKKKNELDNWKNLNRNEKIKYLDKQMKEFNFGLKPIFKESEIYLKSEEIAGKLINIMGKEKDEDVLLKLDDLFKIMKVRVFNEKLKEMFRENKEELVKFMNDELNRNKYNYIYEENIKNLKVKGIEKEGEEWVIKFQGEMEEEEE